MAQWLCDCSQCIVNDAVLSRLAIFGDQRDLHKYPFPSNPMVCYQKLH
jgi:hypothetical protein